MRIRSPHVAAVVLVGLVVAYVGREAQLRDGYATAIVAQSVSTLFFVGPVAGCVAAWRAARLRDGGVLTLAPARSQLRVAAGQARGVALLGWVVLLGGTVASLLLFANGLPRYQDGFALVMGMVVLASHVTVGYAAGMRAHAYVAAPAVLVGLYLWMVFPIAFEPMWIRHVTGFTYSCCGLGSRLDGGALIAPVIVAGGFVAASAVVGARGRWEWQRVLAAPVAIVPAVLLASTFVEHLGPDPAQPRSPTELACDQGPAVVCVWPENAARHPEVAELVGRIHVEAAGLGIPTPTRYTEADVPGEDRETVHFGMRSVTPHHVLHLSLVRALVSPNCVGRDGSVLMSSVDAAALVGWLAIRTGYSVDALMGSMHTDDEAELRRALALPQDGQAAWFVAGYEAVKRCEPFPRLGDSA